jgi:hypothetical protein
MTFASDLMQLGRLRPCSFRHIDAWTDDDEVVEVLHELRLGVTVSI